MTNPNQTILEYQPELNEHGNRRSAPLEVVNLVNRFSEQRDVYKSGKYNETQLRRDFLDSLFKELGWDVDNRKNLSETNRDVINEISVEMEGRSKAADYAFKTNNKIYFFLEAKKPSVNIETNPAPAFQLRSYGWTAKLPFSVLSDFEQIAIYDCRIKPVYGDTPLIARHKLFHYTDYVDKWDEIYNLLSYEAVHAGSLDKLVETVKGKRGTADVDDDFLATMEHWREELARVISLRNLSLTQRQINTAVQLIIDRIIFLRICEDRGIEPENGLREATDGVDVYGDLMALFKKADRKYNSGLFHFETEKGQSSHPDTLTPTLTIDDKVFKDILANLYLPKSPYAFKYFSADILGQVYERFLGKVITLSDGHRSKVIEKPEVRKAGGVYYTPTYIVEYIVRNTIGELLKEKTPADMLVEPIRVLDPACGSGSFLLGAYQYLLNWYLDWYSANDPLKWSKGKNPPIFDNNGWQLTMEKKKEILTSHIFGVDIDAQAVEVTKLSLLLKVVENPGQLSMLEERILPDLGENIKCGNSLIGLDYYQNQQPDLFNSEEQYRVNAFDWQTSFPQAFKVGGFDAVIGNPPYGALFNDTDKKYIKDHFQSYKYKYDSYIYFIEKAITLVKNAGFVSFITPELWLKLESGSSLRQFIASTAGFDLLFVTGENVFENVVVNTIVFRLQKAFISKKLEIKNNNDSWTMDAISWMLADGYIIDYRVNPDIESIINKMRKMSENTLSSLGDVIQGITPYDKYRGQSADLIKRRGYHFDNKNDETCGKWLAGKDISRYDIGWSGEWLSYGSWLAAPRDPRFFNGERLLFREVPGAGKRIQAMIVFETLYHGHSITPFIKNTNNAYKLLFILGVVNSKLISWFGGRILPNFGKEVFPKMNPQDVAAIPIRTINFSDPAEVKQHDRMVALVESMLALHKASAAARLPDEKERLARQIQFTDRQIDQLVYELYGLTEDEIRIVEGG